MKRKLATKYIREGEYVAEVEVELVDDESAWTPYLSVEDARKLDDVRAALKSGDIASAGRIARVYELRPVVSNLDD